MADTKTITLSETEIMGGTVRKGSFVKLLSPESIDGGSFDAYRRFYAFLAILGDNVSFYQVEGIGIDPSDGTVYLFMRQAGIPASYFMLHNP